LSRPARASAGGINTLESIPGSFRFNIENEVKIEALFRLRFDIVAITSIHFDVHIPKIEISQKQGV
jgi:hypothetical protein